MLKKYFPMIRSKKEILSIIRERADLNLVFSNWDAMRQKEFLDFCSGARGVKMLYDSFAKEILNPETVPERLNELLSLLIGEKVEIMQVLPNDNSRIAEESSLLVMDMVVRLGDGSVANIEIQKIGYSFPGQRCACYSADLLLRQYKLVRSQKTRETFSYRDIKNVYTIVFFEKSTGEFHEFPEDFIHYFEQKSNTGLKMKLLQKFIFIPLDIFLEKHHNKNIDNRLVAWLLFLASDAPEDIVSVIERYPDFRAIYEQVYEICSNIEGVMNMFSEELRIMDRNTVRYMMDEMQSDIDKKKEILRQQEQQLSQQEQQLSQQEQQLRLQKKQLEQKETELKEKERKLQEALQELQLLKGQKERI